MKLRAFMIGVIAEKETLGKFKTAELYKTAQKAFGAFLQTDGCAADLDIEAVDAALLLRFEHYLLSVRGMKRNSSSAYMRTLRACYRRAVVTFDLPDRRPFAKVYTGVDQTVKRAVADSVITRLRQLDLSAHPALAQSRDLFLFSFYMRGLSFIDLAKLTARHWVAGRIEYRRSKTHQLISVRLEPPARRLLQRYMSFGQPYLFPILTKGFDGREYARQLSLQNRRLHQIQRMLGLDVPLTTYVARHTWASVAHAMHVPIGLISQSLGHDNERTTQIYLSSFCYEEIDRVNVRILRKVNAPDRPKRTCEVDDGRL